MDNIDPAVWLAILSGILSAGAFVVACITLWFSHLRGPDIDLCNEPKTKVKEISHEKFLEYIPNWLDLAPIQLVFSNSGSRGGVINSVDVKFQPSKGFAPFLSYFSSSATLQGSSGEALRELPVSIRDGDNCVIKLECDLRTFDWKNHIQTPTTAEILNIRKFVEESMKYNRQQFSNFLKFLESREPFGTIILYSTCTSRRWLRTRLVEKKLTDPIEIPNTLEDATIKAFAKCLEEWDFKTSYVEQYLQQVPRILDRFIERLNQNKDSLSRMGFTSDSVLPISSIESELRELNRQTEESYGIRKIVAQREKNLFWDSLNLLDQELKRFNSEVSLILACGKDLEKEQIEHLKAKKEDLHTTVEETIQSLVERRKKLQNEVLLSQND